MIEALRWARLSAGHVGPKGFSTSRAMQQYTASEADFAKEGWGDMPQPEEEWLEEVRRPYTLAEIRLFQGAMHWQYKYLVPDHREISRVLAVWLRTKALKGAFDHQVAPLGYSRSHCYRMRDRGLSLISQGLHRDGVPLPESVSLPE